MWESGWGPDGDHFQSFANCPDHQTLILPLLSTVVGQQPTTTSPRFGTQLAPGRLIYQMTLNGGLFRQVTYSSTSDLQLSLSFYLLKEKKNKVDYNTDDYEIVSCNCKADLLLSPLILTPIPAQPGWGIRAFAEPFPFESGPRSLGHFGYELPHAVSPLISPPAFAAGRLRRVSAPDLGFWIIILVFPLIEWHDA